MEETKQSNKNNSALRGKNLYNYILNHYYYTKKGRLVEIGEDIDLDDSGIYVPFVKENDFETGLFYTVEGDVNITKVDIPDYDIEGIESCEKRTGNTEEDKCKACSNCNCDKIEGYVEAPVLERGITKIYMYTKEGNKIDKKWLGHDCRGLIYDLDGKGSVADTKDVNHLIGGVNAVLNQLSGATGTVEINQYILEVANTFGADISEKWKEITSNKLQDGLEYLLEHPEYLFSESLTIKTIRQIFSTNNKLSDRAIDFLCTYAVKGSDDSVSLNLSYYLLQIAIERGYQLPNIEKVFPTAIKFSKERNSACGASQLLQTAIEKGYQIPNIESLFPAAVNKV